MAAPGQGPFGTLSRRKLLTTTALAAGAVGAGGLLSACGGGKGIQNPNGPAASGGGDANGPVTWGSWANPGEAERFRTYSKNYEQKYGNKITYQVTTGDYKTKLLTQLTGGSAPDAFYVGDDTIAKLIESKSVMDLTEYLSSPDAAVKESDVYPGLIKWVKKGSGIYGMPVDCNPKVFWFNKTMLSDAGVAQNPAQMQEAGTWTRDALDDLLTKVKATGKRGLVFEANWFDLCGWITTLGGKAIDDQGKAIFDTDQKALSILEWLFDRMNKDLISYGGSLPKGQGVDALFYGKQLATIQYGRWILPNLKKGSLQYDIAPLPSESGKDVAPCSIYTACMSVNVKAKDPAAALAFMGRFTSADGQRARLSGGGNAVPCVPGLDDVVTEGNLPEHAKYFVEVAKNGYTVPQVLVENPAAATNLGTNLDKLIKSKPDYKTFATKAAAFMNGKS